MSATTRATDRKGLAGSSGQPARAWQRMLSGRRLDLLDPSPLDIEIEDIAHGLARVARWNGQTKGPHSFSVAQHALFVEAIAQHLRESLPERAALAVLLHDAAEYVIGDMITPFKAVLSDRYKSVEKRLMNAVHLRFGLPAEPSAQVVGLIKQADLVAAHYEASQLAGFGAAEAETLFGPRMRLPPPILDMIHPLRTEAAQARFLERFYVLEAAAQR